MKMVLVINYDSFFEAIIKIILKIWKRCEKEMLTHHLMLSNNYQNGFNAQIHKLIIFYLQIEMSREKIQSLLLKYGLQFQQDVDEAVTCGNSIQKWQAYIGEWISAEMIDSFKSDLDALNFLDGKISQNQSQFDFESLFFDCIGESQAKVNNIYVSRIDEFSWSQKLIQRIRLQSKANIEDSLSKSNTVNQFLKNEIGYLLDLLFRKGDLKEYFEEAKIVMALHPNHQLYRLFREMTFGDFVNSLAFFSKDKRLIGKLLSQGGVPVPVSYQLKRQCRIHLQLIAGCLGINCWSLLLNVGTPATAKCGKTSLVAKMFSLNEQNIAGTHLANTLHLYSKISFAEEGRFALMDFNGQLSDETNPKLLSFILEQCAKSVSLLIIHANENQIKNKIMHQKSYTFLLGSAEKVIIYVRDKPVSKQNALIRYIPPEFKSKVMLVCLDNLKDRTQNIECYKQQLQKIIQNSFNIYQQPKFSFPNLYFNAYKEQYSKYNNQINILMQMIQDSQYKKSEIIPNISKFEQINELQLKIKLQNKQQQKIIQYKQKVRLLMMQLNNPQLSSFVEQSIEIIKKHSIFSQIFAEKLYNWKINKLQHLREVFLSLSDNYNKQTENSAQIKKKIQENEEMRNDYEINVDSIVNQLVFYNQVRRDQRYAQVITDFYRHSFREVSPINLIDGKTLSFGNSALKDTIAALSSQYAQKGKRVYVVSVIGAQSSAKSTLLNFLFRCKFETSAGRCTKGIYLSLVEIEDLVLVVLDTEGLLSVSARDTVFDHQIASFILKISNLIIINNKGELTSTLEQMMQVCLYVLKCLHKDEKQERYNPQKIIFTLRDQIAAYQQIQKQQAAKIKNSLQEIKNNSSFDYNKFFTIQTNDIFSLPSAFAQTRGLLPKSGSIKHYDQTFGKCIFGLRNRIIAYLNSIPSQKNLLQFYEQATRTWQAIQKCGKDIMSFKTFNEITIKKSIQSRFNLKANEYRMQIQQKYEQFFKSIQSIKKSKDLQSPDIKLTINEIKRQNYKIIIQTFKNQCKQICQNQQWIQEFYPKIERICVCYEISYLQKFYRKIQRTRQSQNDANLSLKVHNILANLLQQTRPLQEMINRIKEDMKTLKNEAKKERIVNKAKLQMQIRDIIQNILQFEDYAQLKIDHIEDCYNKYIKVINEQNLNKKINQLFRFDNQKDKNKSEQISLNNIFLQTLQQFQNAIKSQIITSKIVSPLDIDNKRKLFLQLIQKSGKKCQQKVKISNGKALLYNPLFKIVTFGKMYDTMKRQIYQINIKINNKQIEEIQNKMQKQQDNLIRILKMKGNVKQTIDNDINTFLVQAKQEIKKQRKDIIEDQLNKLSLRLTPQSIFSQAMSQTLLNSNILYRKQHYINCYKMIKNINRYLFEIMCSHKQIQKKNSTIQITFKTTENTLQNKIQQLLNQLQRLKQESNDDQIRSFLISVKMVGIAHFQQNCVSIKPILQNLLKRIKENKQTYIYQMTQQNKKQIKILQAYTNSFIETTLKEKIIGCQQTCPICGMKCMLPKGHQQNHKVLNNCHSLAAFGGSQLKESKNPRKTLCQQKQNINSKWVFNKDGKTQQYKNLKQLIIAKYPRWQSDFPNMDQEQKFQKLDDKVRLLKIWANIESVLIKTKFTNLKEGNSFWSIIMQWFANVFQGLQKQKDTDELTEDDLNFRFIDLGTNAQYSLKDY